jgi:tetratricopeptide (TPR) repeat protein
MLNPLSRLICTLRKPNQKIALLLLGMTFAVGSLYQIPGINSRLSWRLDAVFTYLRGFIYPADAPPSPSRPPALTTPAVLSTPTRTSTPDSASVPVITATPSPTPFPLPETVSLPPPTWEKQDWNNCGPATLALYLRMYGWHGDQYTISDLLKPEREDRNVNVEELIYFARTQAGWLNAEYRVGGDLNLLKQFLAAGIPVMIEEGFEIDTNYWLNDDRWAGHYLLVTGYDDVAQAFTGQDTYYGADRQVPYQKLDANWKDFNRVYILLYPPEKEEVIRNILGSDWDPDQNRQNALDWSRAEIEADPEDTFAWFNLGTNLVYFERYAEAAEAYDKARILGLPQRMLRYQFGPFMAYFHGFRTEDLMELTDYALQRTPNSEEALLWQGWGYYRIGDTDKALKNFRAALVANPNYLDAQYAIDYVIEN